MKRLLRISLNSAIFSFIPILSWFLLGLLVDVNLTNVFMLTYPFQFIWQLLSSIFATGANICKEKENDKDAVLSGMTLGMIIGFIIFGFIALNIDSYINFMHMDVSLYKDFTLYSVILLYLELYLSFVLEKLYFEGKEDLANDFCLIYNLINIFALTISSIIFKNRIYIIVLTLFFVFLYTMYITIIQYKSFNFKINIIKYIKYNLLDIFECLAFFIIYLFGLSNALNFGAEYLVAINFIALITDTQWDTVDSICTVAKIDISKNQFDYKEHVKNAYKLIFILISSSVLLFLILYRFYDLNMQIALIFFTIEIVNFLVYPPYIIKAIYLQLEWSTFKTTCNKMVSLCLRTIMSFLKTPFCTGIGQICSLIYQSITFNFIYKKVKTDNDLKLVEVDLHTFKDEIYDKYINIFPKDEVKNYEELKEVYDKKVCHFIAIKKNKTNVGFMILYALNDVKFIHVDYFAIFSEYRDKGYGREAINLLKDLYKNYEGIIGEIETIQYGNDENEIMLRKKRKNFYDKIGFKFINCELVLYDVIFTPIFYTFNNETVEDKIMMKDLFKIYNVVYGEDEVKNYCKINFISKEIY